MNNPYESLSRGLAKLLYAKKVITESEYNTLLTTMEPGSPYEQFGFMMEMIADGILRKEE